MGQHVAPGDHWQPNVFVLGGPALGPRPGGGGHTDREINYAWPCALPLPRSTNTRELRAIASPFNKHAIAACYR